jgi:carbon monoxide dehydrogenase subunit G
MTVEASININKNKTIVWNAITDIRHAAEIISGIEKIEIISLSVNGLVGLKWNESRMYFGKPVAVEKCIIEAVENEYYKTKAEMDGFTFFTTTSILENEKFTEVISTHETQAMGMLAKIKSLPMFFFKGILKKAILKDLHDVKKAVEQS